jgi:hypothetical protein
LTKSQFRVAHARVALASTRNVLMSVIFIAVFLAFPFTHEESICVVFTRA